MNAAKVEDGMYTLPRGSLGCDTGGIQAHACAVVTITRPSPDPISMVHLHVSSCLYVESGWPFGSGSSWPPGPHTSNECVK